MGCHALGQGKDLKDDCLHLCRAEGPQGGRGAPGMMLREEAEKVGYRAGKSGCRPWPPAPVCRRWGVLEETGCLLTGRPTWG